MVYCYVFKKIHKNYCTNIPNMIYSYTRYGLWKQCIMMITIWGVRFIKTVKSADWRKEYGTKKLSACAQRSCMLWVDIQQAGLPALCNHRQEERILYRTGHLIPVDSWPIGGQCRIHVRNPALVFLWKLFYPSVTSHSFLRFTFLFLGGDKLWENNFGNRAICYIRYRQWWWAVRMERKSPIL